VYNAEHLQILKRGVEAWNKWREQNPEIHPCLRGANLTKAKLTRVNLRDMEKCVKLPFLAAYVTIMIGSQHDG